LTFRSLTIESHPSLESAQAHEGGGKSYENLQSLNAYTFPKPLRAFAEEHRLDIFYVDNAWIRVAMNGRLLKQFMAFGHETEIDLAGQMDRVRDEGWYVVNEEEF
jgi:hypothetical protein